MSNVHPFLASACLGLLSIAAPRAQSADDLQLAAAQPGTVLEGTTPCQWRVVWTTEPQTRALIVWSTREPGKRHEVRIDTEPHDGDLDSYRKVVRCKQDGRYAAPSDGPELYYHAVQLERLKPATTYYLVMTSDGESSREFHFVTAPDDDRHITLLSGGDSRSGRDTRRRMNVRLSRLFAADGDNIIALAHGGDYVFNGMDLGLWSDWLTDLELTVTPAGRLLPIIPTRGNHEGMGELFDQVFGSPGGGLGKNYFATELSRDALLLTLNSEVSAGGDQRKFLERALAKNRNTRWKVAQYHRAIYPAIKRPSRGKRHWTPLFDKYHVDLALESDGHALKRTVPIRDDKTEEGGVVYIGEGGLGVPQRSPRDRWYLAEPGMAISAHHVWKIGFFEDRIELDAILLDGKIADHSTIDKAPSKRGG